jgi:hypothetical protein
MPHDNRILPAAVRKLSARIGFRFLMRLVRWWAENHMDQWEKVVSHTAFGPIYLSITLETEWPDSFDAWPPARRAPQPEGE